MLEYPGMRRLRISGVKDATPPDNNPKSFLILSKAVNNSRRMSLNPENDALCPSMKLFQSAF